MAYELIKVSELPELTTPSDPNVLPIQDGDYLKRISFENLKEAATGDVAGDLAAEVTARESAVSGEATARGNADTAILADLASPYSASATYAVGDYCIKDGQLYRCTTAISTAEAWTAAHWSAVALGDDTRDLRSAITQLDDAVYGEVDNTFPLAFEGGTYYSTTTGQPLEKYYGGGYDKTRKVVKSTVFNAPCNVRITAKTGYSFTAFTSDNGVITSNSGLVTEYSMVDGHQYGMVLRANNGSDDISAIDVSAIIDIEYISHADELQSAFNSVPGNIMASVKTVTGLFINTSGVLTSLSSGADRTICVKGEANRTYKIKKATSTIMRAACGASASETAGTQLTGYSGHASASSDALTVKTNSTNVYIYIQLYADTDATALKTIEANISTLIVCEDMPSELVETKSVVSSIVNKKSGHNIYDYTQNLVNKYLNPSGVMEDYNGRYVTDYIPVVEGKYITLSNLNPAKIVTQTGYAAICCYDGNKNVVAGGNYNKTTFLVPSGVLFVRITLSGTMNGATTMIELTDDGLPTTFAYYCGDSIGIDDGIKIPAQPLGYMRVTGDIESGQSLTLPYHNVKNNNVLVFTGHITNFSKLKIGKQSSTYITIDDTNIVITNDQGSRTEAHGLIIANDIQVIIENETDLTASLIRITSSGASYTVSQAPSPRFLMDEGTPYVTSDGSVLTGCVFTWTSRNINKPIWLFGDSYFSWYPSRWTYYLAQDGFAESCMLNGYAGEASDDAMTALRRLLAVRVPQYVVWCMGMNNADYTTRVNYSWENNYNALRDLAKVYRFTLILATIPTTPDVNNNFKNAIIKASGYRYIDFDSAVDPNGDGTWISGTLSSDNVHPTEKGAKVLYMKALADFPELTSK